MIDLDKANTDKPRCLLFTAFYPFMVRVLGGSAFLGADATSALVTEEERKSYLDAFNAMTTTWSGPKTVSYTHLDVYKRQFKDRIDPLGNHAAGPFCRNLLMLT